MISIDEILELSIRLLDRAQKAEKKVEELEKHIQELLKQNSLKGI